MRYLLALGLSFFLAFTAHAEVKRKHSYGELDVHYNIFSSTFLQPETARAVGLNRSKNQAVLNISMVKSGQGEKGSVTGGYKNLLGQDNELTFTEIDEGDAVYYLAQFTISSREVLIFDLQITDSKGQTHLLKFNQEVFPDL
ncbi:DUF4426 domain-containing protein [Denitrificimonas sp. JX-1]|uniref:DUF4426 domain-containing protein n=1 Tax=Denitrificimonas halotolerans TaxID=3098930 RepID=A0ABU5GT20_9GAMM|nr:DUF4426 domain-containing protein [Denitrificimonas sp. JX-1]MDY7219762.1 DUF4426 domain-containing protein [Denitrificimonas sp. JX-1]